MQAANDGSGRARAFTREEGVEMVLLRQLSNEAGAAHRRGRNAPMQALHTHFVEGGLGCDGLMCPMEVTATKVNDAGSKQFQVMMRPMDRMWKRAQQLAGQPQCRTSFSNRRRTRNAGAFKSAIRLGERLQIYARSA